jgi:CheY-like chemotaxis protein
MRAFDQVRFTSQISVPLLARGRTIGGITFTLGPGERRYDASDVRVAEDFAQRAAIAVDNARLYRVAQEGEAAAALGQRRARFRVDVSIRGRLQGVRVLVVDDDDDARALVQAIVEEAGGVATTVDSGLRALQRLDQEVPDLMVADLGMPGMDGLALIEAVRRRQDDARAVPAIALTAYTRSEDRITALSRGFQRHLSKPIDHIQLVSAVLSVVTLERPPTPSGRSSR